MGTLKKHYSDIDLTFTRIPGKNDIALSYDEMSVIRSVRNLLLTKNYERPFNSVLGSKLGNLLFEPIDFITAQAIKQEIIETINNFEPRATLSEITIYENLENNAYDVSMSFYIGNNTTPTSINLILERTR